VEFFEISDKEDWSHANSALCELEERFTQFPFDAPGLLLTRDSSSRDPADVREVVNHRRYSRDLYLHLSAGIIQAAFREGQDSDFDSAWDQAWDALSNICRPERQVHGYEPNYLLPPERLSELLTRAAAEAEP
jgi:hypothetical protein